MKDLLSNEELIAYQLEKDGTRTPVGTIADPLRLKPVRWLNYPGNVSHMVGQIVGPNTMGEHWLAVTTYWDGRSTRVGFVVPTKDNVTPIPGAERGQN